MGENLMPSEPQIDRLASIYRNEREKRDREKEAAIERNTVSVVRTIDISFDFQFV